MTTSNNSFSEALAGIFIPIVEEAVRRALHARIYDSCWADRKAIYQARKGREATQELNPKRQAAAKKAVEARRRQAEFNAELPTSELLH